MRSHDETVPNAQGVKLRPLLSVLVALGNGRVASPGGTDKRDPAHSLINRGRGDHLAPSGPGYPEGELVGIDLGANRNRPGSCLEIPDRMRDSR